LTDPDYNILMINKAGAGLVGKRCGECFDRKCYEIFNTPLCNTPNCTCRLAMENQSIIQGQTVLFYNEQEIPIEYSARPLRNYKGEIIGCVENFIDITGVPMVDSEVASHILQTANATRLMGSEAILTGVGPHIAQVIAQGGVGLENLTVRGRMTDALHFAIGQLALKSEQVARATALVRGGSK
jgi:hypothetical protein